MPARMRTEQIESALADVVMAANARVGQTFPLKNVYDRAGSLHLTENDIVDGLRALKNKHLLTADERLTAEFFSHFKR